VIMMALTKRNITLYDIYVSDAYVYRRKWQQKHAYIKKVI